MVFLGALEVPLKSYPATLARRLLARVALLLASQRMDPVFLDVCCATKTHSGVPSQLLGSS